MSNRYRHLLSPLKIGNVVLKNRMLSSNALPHFLQGPESFPNDQVIIHLSNLAKNGAAIVSFAEWTDPEQRKYPIEDVKRFPMYDINDPSVHNYISQLIDAIHFYDSKASICMRPVPPKGYGVCESSGSPPPPENDNQYDISDEEDEPSIFSLGPTKELTEELMEEMIQDTIQTAKFYQSLGYDMASFHMAYRAPVLGQFLSPLTNKRTDKYGGSLENRARFPLAICQSVKEACGEDFLIEVIVSGEEEQGGITVEDTVAFAKLAEGKIDILQLRAGDGSASHPTGFNSKKKYPLTLGYSQAIKESNAKIITAPIGGFQDLGLNEEYIATGKADMIAMARAFICDPEYARKAYEGRGEDVVPCIRCNKCHVPSLIGPWLSICSVNPLIGIAHRVNGMIDAPISQKKVAIIGGGPAGMKAALVASERGHKVTLYEKNHFLGGQLIHADYSSFKWPIRDFKDYLIRQIEKSDVKVFLSTTATPEMVQAKGFDAILVAAGADPVIPDIPGADGPSVWTPINVYGNEKDLGENVVVVGGAEIGVETGMHLADKGHMVTLLTRQKQLAYDATPIHYIEMVRDAWEALDTFSYITQVSTTKISQGEVTYVDTEGNEKSIPADSVVVSGGLKPRQDEALEFYGSADRFFIIGDCRAVGNVQKCMRSAFATASQL